MKISGSATLQAPAQRVWDRMLDPEALARAIPGCESLERVGPDEYRGTVSAGVGSIKGTFQGGVRLCDLRPAESLTMRAQGSGAPGTVTAEIGVRLADLGDGRTELSYDADAVVGGMVGGVGQRMLAGVAKKMAGEFLGRLGDEVAGRPAGSGPAPEAATSAPAPGAATVPAPAATVVPAATVGDGAAAFVRGALFGAAAALAGVAVGAWAGRRAR
ncbi:SRPBCC family protein [Streptomonospora wellingtoniae]|uniref:Carbon monoxide dehydrogenase subunit G n=1 Tax=Streptomonospora wellingtoniae TaxID=3075544 RepID=A0ABU2KQB1_9ACTN|nr:carbon monoxide dehydrogenase subunit G [Streptomonospora sp. DSM 45055]MDT0301480.1 carbon monoxide dehydrogenase subunit G [Streptomonospora sp. DSM 45055]